LSYIFKTTSGILLQTNQHYDCSTKLKLLILKLIEVKQTLV